MYYVRCGPNKNNMGDLIGPYLYAKLNGGVEPKLVTTATTTNVLLTCGSVLQPQLMGPNVVVWGSGIITNRPAFSRKPKKITAVRGPLSRQALVRCGIACPEVYGDPGLLLPRFYPRIVARPTFKIGIIPHYVDYEYVKRLVGQSSDVCVIQMDPIGASISNVVEGVCQQIQQCECTVSSSLHGLVVSHAYGVPAGWMTTKNTLWGDGVKYYDYFASIGLTDRAALKPLSWQQLEKMTPEELQTWVTTYKGANVATMPNLDLLLASCPFAS